MKALIRLDLKPYLEGLVGAPFILHSKNETILGILVSLQIEKERSDSVMALRLIAQNVITIDLESKKQIGTTKPETIIEYIDSPLLVERKTGTSITIRSHQEILTLFDPEAGRLNHLTKNRKAV